MLQNISNNNGVAKTAVVDKKIEKINERIDGIDTEITNLNSDIGDINTSIDELENRTSNLETGAFETLSSNTLVATNKITPKTGTNINIDADISTDNITATSITADSATIGGVDFTDVRDTASCAISISNIVASDVNDIQNDISNIQNDIASLQNPTSISTPLANITNLTASSVVTDGLTANIAEANKVRADIETSNITANKVLPLPEQMATPSDWYAITIPNGKVVQLSGTYTDENDVDHPYIFEVGQSFVAYDAENSIVKDISFDKITNNTKIRIKSTTDVAYIQLDTLSTTLSIERSGNAYSDYSYISPNDRGILFKGFDDGTTQYYFPGAFSAYGYYVESGIFDEIRIVNNISLPADWTASAILDYSKGSEGDVIQKIVKCGDERPTWTSPISGTDSILEYDNSTDLITAEKVGNYDGRSCDGNSTSCNIEYLGNATARSLTSENNVTVTCDLNTHSIKDATEITIDTPKTIVTGDLYVQGTTHTVDEESIETLADTIVLRANNNTALANNQVSGITINKYDGCKNLNLVTDNDGTLRVGTASGTDTTYTFIALNHSDNNYYTFSGDTYTLLSPQPSGTMTSWNNKEEISGYTRWASATFTEVDTTTLEPLLTRDEECNMTDGNALIWDCSNNKAITSSHIHENNNKIEIDNLDVTNLTSCTLTNTGNTVICGDLTVCGTTTVHGDYTQCINATADTATATLYPTLVDAIGSVTCVKANDCFYYNAASNILTAPTVQMTTLKVGTASSCGAGLTATGQAIEMFGLTPFIDFHYNCYCGDYSHRIIACGNCLCMIVTNAYASTAPTCTYTYKFGVLGDLTAACFCGNLCGAAACLSKYNGYCLDYYAGNTDRVIPIGNIDTSCSCAVLGSLGRSTNCQITFNPSTGVLCAANTDLICNLDFHRCCYCGDYSHRICPSNNGLEFIVSNGCCNTAPTNTSTFRMTPYGALCVSELDAGYIHKSISGWPMYISASSGTACILCSVRDTVTCEFYAVVYYNGNISAGNDMPTLTLYPRYLDECINPNFISVSSNGHCKGTANTGGMETNFIYCNCNPLGGCGSILVGMWNRNSSAAIICPTFAIRGYFC